MSTRPTRRAVTDTQTSVGAAAGWCIVTTTLVFPHGSARPATQSGCPIRWRSSITSSSQFCQTGCTTQ